VLYAVSSHFGEVIHLVNEITQRTTTEAGSQTRSTTPEEQVLGDLFRCQRGVKSNDRPRRVRPIV